MLHSPRRDAGQMHCTALRSPGTVLAMSTVMSILERTTQRLGILGQATGLAPFIYTLF